MSATRSCEHRTAGYPLPDLAELAAALERGERELAVGGVVPAARALPLAALASRGWPAAPATVVVPHLRDAEELAAGLRLLVPSLAIAAVPAEVAAPYHGAEPPLAARLALVRVLTALARDELDVVVVPARALASPIPDPAAVQRLVTVICVGDLLDTAELARRLATAGYRRVDLVEEAGELAVRGWVVDVHAGDEHGFRLELDDDRVEAIRPFDSASQRTAGSSVERVELPPMDPFPVTAERVEALARRLDPEWPALAGMVRSGAERRLWWGALHLVEGSSTTWLGLAHAVVVCDRDEVTGELARWTGAQRREWQTLAERSVPLPPPDQLLADPDRLRPVLEAPALRIEQLEVANATTRWWRLRTHPGDSFVRRLPDLVPTLRHRRALDLAQVLVVASSGEERRFAHLLGDGEVVPSPPPPGPGGVAIVLGELEHGFVWDGGLAVYGRRDLTAVPPPRRRRSATAAFVSDLRDLRPGDLVVHVDHGIGRFTGFRRVPVEGRTLEMLALAYLGGDSLLVPVERADLIQKYASGDGEGAPRLDRLGGSTWRRRTARVKKAVKEMAAELLRLAAVRQAARGHAYSPDSPWQREFEDAFEHDLTFDQERAVTEIKQRHGVGAADGPAARAATSATARPRSRSGPPSRRCWTASRWRCWRRPRFWSSSTSRPSDGA